MGVLAKGLDTYSSLPPPSCRRNKPGDLPGSVFTNATTLEDAPRGPDVTTAASGVSCEPSGGGVTWELEGGGSGTTRKFSLPYPPTECTVPEGTATMGTCTGSDVRCAATDARNEREPQIPIAVLPRYGPYHRRRGEADSVFGVFL
jgi:hypothetical protein